MMPDQKQLSNPFSTGGGGTNFETHVQAMFTVLMLTGGVAPGLPSWPIKKIKLQGKYAGFNTDDCILFTKEPNGTQEARLLAQIKHSISITEAERAFSEVIHAAWSDFNNPKIFDRENDVIALITGPLSAADIENVRTILEWARHSENASEFIWKVEKSNFSSDLKRAKLQAFRFNLEKAKGQTLSDEELWSFVKKFHLLGYDFDVKSGADLALIVSLISQFAPSDPKKLWLHVLDEVLYANQNAGTLTIETVSSEIRSAFTKPQPRTIPQEFVKKSEVEIVSELLMSQCASEIALAMLLGSWDESVDNDKRACEKLYDKPYSEWIAKLRQIVVQPEAPLMQKDRKWKVAKRLEAWNAFGPRVFDEHLNRLKEIAVIVLREPDPKFELPKEEHFAARVRGKVPLHSEHLRDGLAETLALLGSYPKGLSSCSLHKPEGIAAVCVREVLDNADWPIWASLNDVLPLLAEASPNELLDAVERTLNNEKGDTFRSVFALEGSGFGGWNYMTGLLWALETLAWHPDYLTRVTVLLGQLAELDPGGNWANRPVSSLTTIFLPWSPQTAATIEKRRLAVEALLRECPTVGWKLLLSLLPNARQMTMGSRKPKWREFIPKEQLQTLSSSNSRVTNKDYFEQVGIYSSLAVQNAKSDLERLQQLVAELDDLPDPAFSEIILHLSSEEISNTSQKQRLPIWETLTDFVSKHRKFSDAKWALPKTEVDRIAKVADSIQPSSPQLVHRRLFGTHEVELYDEKGNYEEQSRRIADRRTKAVEEILEISGIVGVINFSRSVQLPTEVGLALGRVARSEHDVYFLPDKLTAEEKVLKDVTYGYVCSRFHLMGWQWVDNLETKHWTDQHKAAFLEYLPFTKETWQRVKSLLGENEFLYWKAVDARPYHLKEELREAVEKLLQYDRPRAAIQCLNWMLYEKMEISLDHAYQALLHCPTSQEPPQSLDQHDITELIKWLQHNPQADKDTLLQVEWIYLPLLDHHFGSAPVTLEQKLADDPAFFCEVIRTVFRSEKEKEEPAEITEERKQLATQAFGLLYHWRTPPGTEPNGTFDASKLREWIVNAKMTSEETGHLQIALDQIGKVLAHSPADPTGLWIHKGVAEVLNEKEADAMRSAFTAERFNMRGAFWGSKGEEEKKLALNYCEKAEAVEKQGYIRLAASLRGLADSYERQAEREALHDPFED